MNDEPAVRVDRVSKRYGAVEALLDVSFTVARGEMFGLIGPDGAGKTTTIRLLCGLLHQDAGTIRVLGRDPHRDHRALTTSVGYLSQRFSLYGDLSIDENIAFFAAIHGMRDYAARRDELLAITQLTPFRSRLADRLSGGMKQKLALACTLIHQPSLIVLDEPTTGVDPVSRREFWKLLSRFLDAGITILMSTPYLDEAERCHRIAMLHEGRVLALDAPGTLRQSLAGHWFEVVLPDSRAAMARLERGRPASLQLFLFGDRLHARLDAADAGVAQQQLAAALAAAAVPHTSVRPIVPSLEDVFVAELTGTVTP